MGGDFSLTRPITVFTGTVPDSIQWPDNLQNEYYIINATGFDIQLATGFSYIDPYLTIQTIVPARTTIHIAKAQNLSWLQVNNAVGEGTLPPQTGHEGEFLMTNGNSAKWFSPCLYVSSDDFEADGVTYLNPNLTESKFLLFWNEVPRFLYDQEQNPGQIEWHYKNEGGFEIVIPGFDANINDVHIYLFLKALNS